MQGMWVRSLVGGLRSHMSHGQKNKCNIVTNSIKTLKIVHTHTNLKKKKKRPKPYCDTAVLGPVLKDKLLGVKLERIPLMDSLSSASKLHAWQRKLLHPALQLRYGGGKGDFQHLGTHLGLPAIDRRDFPRA